MCTHNIKDITIVHQIKQSDKSTVSLAMIRGINEPVIVKYMTEAKPEIYNKIQGLHSNYFPEIYDYYIEDKSLVVIEEYISGTVLREYTCEKQLDAPEILSIFKQLCEAVKILHSCEPAIIHRDIKPDNIIYTAQGQLKIVDFDAAREYHDETQTTDTIKLGTIEYAPPEQFGYSQTDIRSDIYAMGVVLFELSYNKRFSKDRAGKNNNSSNNRIFQNIIDKCTSFSPSERYQNVEALLTVLNRIHFGPQKSFKKIIIAVLSIICVVIATGISMLNLWDNQIQTISDAGITPTQIPVNTPNPSPTAIPEPSEAPTQIPVDTLSPSPTAIPKPSEAPTQIPVDTLSPSPTAIPEPSEAPTQIPVDTLSPSPTATPEPTRIPQATGAPTIIPVSIASTDQSPGLLQYPAPSLTTEELDEIYSDPRYNESAMYHFYSNPDISDDILVTPRIETANLLKILCLPAGKSDFSEAIELENNTDYHYVDGVLVIKKCFLNRLAAGYYYQLRSCFDNNTSNTIYMNIHEESDWYINTLVKLSISNTVYVRGSNQSESVALNNRRDLLIDDVLIKGESIPEEYYRLFYNGAAVRFYPELYDHYGEKEDFSILFRLNDGSSMSYYISMGDEKRIYPKSKESQFKFVYGQESDVVIPIVWNDYSHVIQIHTLNSNDKFPDNAWYQSKDSVTITKEYLGSILPGTYHWVVEFGDVGFMITIKISETAE